MTSFRFDTGRSIVGRFRRDTRGGVIIAFAGAAMCLMMIAAGGIEMHRRNLAVAQLQNAVDAAALAGKQRQNYYLSKGDISVIARLKAQRFARDMFEQTMSGYKKSFASDSANYDWNTDGSFTVSSTQSYAFLFGSLMPASFKKVSVKATADFSRSTPTEIAMVVDTTASMFEKDGRADTRFTLMREASKKFAQQLFDAAQAAGDPNLVRVSVVPWATSVNIKGEAPAAADYSSYSSGTLPDYGSRKWVASPIARAPDFTGTSFAPVQWRGCISGETENKTAYSDSSVSSFKALANAPAAIYEPTFTTGPMKPTTITVVTTCKTLSAPYYCEDPPGTQGFHRLIEKAVPQVRSAAFLFDKGADKQGRAPVEKSGTCQSCLEFNTENQTVNMPDCTGATPYKLKYCNYYAEGGRRNSYFPTSMNCTQSWDGCYDEANAPKADTFKAACTADPNEPGNINESVPYCDVYTNYYDPKPWQTYTTKKIMGGPNVVCPMPMLGLSGNRKQVIDTLDRLSPVPGGTHADVGLRWGLRSLSKDNSWPSFFGLTRAPEAFGGAAQKVMVLITDGENEMAQDYKGYWGCSAIDAKNRPDCTAGVPTVADLDTYMQGWCSAIRDKYKVQLYAIAVNIGNAAAVARLQACTGDPSKVFAVDAADLSAVLSGIANRVMAMRLVN